MKVTIEVQKRYIFVTLYYDGFVWIGGNLLFITRIRMSNCYPDETRGRHFMKRNRRYTGQEEGGTHVFYRDFSGHGTETSN